MWQELIDNTALSRSCQVLQVSSQAKGRCKKDKSERLQGLATASKEDFWLCLKHRCQWSATRQMRYCPHHGNSSKK